MTRFAAQPRNPTATDKDLADQALPGHGIPSQDPDASAQVALNPHDAQREAKSVLIGGGAVAGAATGATIGVAVGGPVGVVVGVTAGAVAGALGGAAAGAAANPKDPDPADDAPSVRLPVDTAR
ncbi:hypothetical protein [Rhodoferax saidenbachensis]|uniref:Bacteriocin n=1 Tax=Rhodoferax saidenbachensis TaxID=1484693 RepID=A0A1P8K733_9BURK|nr:hypothetical protein [Rhodoferax saidenbachensis]APW41823.1 hypothetical protein RS694_04195 [Rhodoferax saidenbachensis]